MKTKTSNFFSVTGLTLCGVMLFALQARSDEKDTLNTYDVKFVKKTAADGAAEVKLAGLAVKKAERADIKSFAEMLVTDHTKANDELKALAKKKGVQLSAEIDPAHAETFQKLEKYSGTEFDKEFISEMVSKHKDCVSSFESASKDARDGDLKVWVIKMLPTLKGHLDMAENLKSK